MKNGHLNTSQRQALVKLVENAYNRRLSEQRSVCSDAVARITIEVKQELGVVDIDEQIQCHESLIKELEAQKEKLGFSKYGNDTPIPGSEAKKLINKRSASEKQKIAKLEQDMDALMSTIWTAGELAEVKPQIDEVIGGK
jgi:hypothetical protein